MIIKGICSHKHILIVARKSEALYMNFVVSIKIYQIYLVNICIVTQQQ